MRVLLTTVVLLAVTLAGCSDEPLMIEEDGFDDLEVEVSEDTGGIRGVVINDAIVPVQGVLITLVGNDKTATTDVEGRFAFGNLAPGTYFLAASKELHEEVQVSTDVVAGVAEPAILKVQLNRMFQADPYMATLQNTGFFTCSQANFPGYLYSSSPCHSFNVVDLDDYGVELAQQRDFHADVGAGWQTMIFEMMWEPSAQGTSQRMGMSVSTYKPERNTDHWFASYASGSPMRFQLDTEIMHETAQEGSGPMGPVPSEGMTDMSMYMSVRSPEDAVCAVWCVPPGLALDQSFEFWHTQFYYAPAPEGWSVVNGDQNPF